MFDDYLVLSEADIYAHSDSAIKKYLPAREKAREYYSEIIENGECYELSQLKVSGDDLIGKYDGKKTGEILNFVLDKVMREEIPNEREALLSLIKTDF